MAHWPKDVLRPNVSFQHIFQRRLEKRLGSREAVPENKEWRPPNDSIDLVKEGEEANALFSLLENCYSKKVIVNAGLCEIRRLNLSVSSITADTCTKVESSALPEATHGARGSAATVVADPKDQSMEGVSSIYLMFYSHGKSGHRFRRTVKSILYIYNLQILIYKK